MSKMKQIAALTAMLVVVIMYASPAKSAVCFLPDDDGSCGGGDIEISDDSTSENQCADFNLSQNQRNSKEYDSDCYTCEPCTYNGRTTYKCALNSGATWYGGNLSVCCTGGEKYDSADGKCCPAGGCVHNCPEGQSWDSSAKSCKCDNGKDADGGICCADSEHVSDGICCPEKKHNENGECVCDANYVNDGTGCKPIDKCKDYDLVSEKDSNCYSCSVCPDDSTKYKCTENINSNYQLINGVCSKKSSTYTITVTDTKILQSSGNYDVKKLNKRSITSTNSAVTVDVTTIGVEKDWLQILHCGAPYDCDHGHMRETEITIKNGSEWEEERRGSGVERYTLSQVFTSMYVTINGKSFPAVDTNNATCISTSVKDTNGDIYNVVCKNIEENCPTGYKRGDITCASGYNRVEDSNISGCYKCEKVKQTITITVTDNINPRYGHSCDYHIVNPAIRSCTKYRFTRDVSSSGHNVVIGNKGKLSVPISNSQLHDEDVSFEVNVQYSLGTGTNFDFDCYGTINAVGSSCLNLQEFNIRIEGVPNTYKTRKTCEEKTLEIHGRTFNIKCEGNASHYFK